MEEQPITQTQNNTEAPQKFRRPKKDFKPRKEEWVPHTDLGHLVKNDKITLDEIFRHSLKIRESKIIDHLLGDTLKEARLSVKSVQKQTKAGQKTRLKVCVVVGDGISHVGLGCKSASDVATATKGAIEKAKCNLRQIKLGYWGNAVGEPHTVKARAEGKCGSVSVRVFPGAKGTGLVTGLKVRKIYEFAGIKDVNTFSRGSTKTTENFAKATIQAIENASNFFTKDLWAPQVNELNPLLKNSKFLSSLQNQKK